MREPLEKITNPLSLDDLRERRVNIEIRPRGFTLKIGVSEILMSLIAVLVATSERSLYSILFESPWYIELYIVLLGLIFISYLICKAMDLYKKYKTFGVADSLYLLRHDIASYIVYLNECIQEFNETVLKNETEYVIEKQLVFFKVQIADAKDASEIIFHDDAEWADEMYELSNKLTVLRLIGRNYNIDLKQVSID